MSVALVTGASSGIGRAVAIALAARGHDVALVARRRELLAEVAVAVEAAGRRAAIAVADVGVRSEVESAVARAVSSLGPVDVLVNNAGMPAGARFLDLTPERIEETMRVNFLGAVYATKAVLPAMMERRSGSIVFVASVAGRIGVPGAAAYAATKHAVIGFAEALRLEVGTAGVRIGVVNPGPIRTETFPHPRVRRRLLRTPEQVAGAVVRASRRGSVEIFIPWYFRLVPALAVVAPPLYRAALRVASAMPGVRDASR